MIRAHEAINRRGMAIMTEPPIVTNELGRMIRELARHGG